jgi:protein-disulfide isomerase
MRKIWFPLIGLLAFAGIASARADGGLAPRLVADTKTVLAVTPDDRVLGDPKAPITIVEYASLNCPHCAHFALDVLPKLKPKWIDSGKAKLVLRDFPLDQKALKAAMITRCAPPDRYYGFVDTFMKAQSGWVNQPDYLETLSRLAKLGGMSQKQFDTCLKNQALEDKLAESRLVADQELGVDSTPTFFINGRKFTGDPSVDAIDQALSNLSAKS